jgi:hypothetical protein
MVYFMEHLKNREEPIPLLRNFELIVNTITRNRQNVSASSLKITIS